MGVNLTVTKTDGIQESVPLMRGSQVIDLSNQGIQSIDLMPLVSKSDTKRISLQGNPLKRIDLSPLIMSSELERLRLDEGTDATTWVNLRNVRQLLYSRWRPPRIDADKVGSDLGYYDEEDEASRERWYMDDEREELVKQELELAEKYETEKSFHKYIVRYCPPRPVESWPPLYDFLQHYQPEAKLDRMILNYGLPYALGVGLSGAIIMNSVPLELCLSFSRKTSLKQIRDIVADQMIESVAKQLESGGTTIGLRMEELASSFPEIATRFEDIADGRQSEVEKIVIFEGRNWVDLRPLWLTAYGFEILTSLEMDLICVKKKLTAVKDALQKVGVELRTSDDKNPLYPDAVSEEFRELIWWIARNSRKYAWLENEPRYGWWDFELQQGGPPKFMKWE